MMNISTQNCRIDSLSGYYNFPASIDVLRLDLIHPVISGNKWFKLKEYLKEAKALDKNTVLTFGGAYSNHILATAAAAKFNGLESIGIIRGEEPAALSVTLTNALGYGMQLYFISRQAYKQKHVPAMIFQEYKEKNIYLIPEGGYGLNGMLGAKEILHQKDAAGYTHIVTAVGTGTTIAGLAAAVTEKQIVLGIPVLKNNHSLEKEIESILPEAKHNRFALMDDYHFGGYAKHTEELINFMNSFFTITGIPTDFVYTGKAAYAMFDLMRKNYFNATDKLLFIHTGGLQGNNGLKKGTLIF